MTKFYLIILALVATVLPAFSQEKDSGKQQKFLEYKLRYLAQEMELQDDQKDRFFTIYIEESDKIRDAYKEARSLERKIKEEAEPSEEDYKKLREAQQKAADEQAEIEKEYDAKYSEFLTQKQMFQMKEAETKFRDKMQQMRANSPARKLSKSKERKPLPVKKES